MSDALLPVPDAAPSVPPTKGVDATATPSGAPQNTMPPAKVETWRQRIKADLEATKPAIDQGKTNVARYTGKYLETTPKDDECLVPSDFYFIEAKRNQVFYRTPDLFVKPEQPGIEDAAVVFQAALNKKLGAQGVNVLPTVKQVIFDVLCPTGFGALSLGVQTVADGEVPVQVGMEPDPDAPVPPMAPGSILGLGQPPMRPVFQNAPNIVAKWYFVEHIKPGDIGVPAGFVGLDFDKAPYLFQRFKEDVPDGDETGGSSSESDDRRLSPLPSSARSALSKQRTGYEVWYRAHLFDDDVKHPDKIRVFKVYDDDHSAAVEVRDHPHQRYADQYGKLAKGMQGYPICPLTLRYVSDTWMPPSDATMARNTADELSKGRTQMLQSRNRSLPQWGYDSTRVDKDIQGKIERNEVQGGIPFNGPGADATWPIQKGNGARETYTFNDVAQQDLHKIWRMGSNQVGSLDDKSRTATEQQITQNASQEASESDRTTVLEWYVKVAMKFAALMQLYATEQEFVELIGADAQRLKNIPPDVAQQAQAAGQDARVLVPWNMDTISGPFAFSAKPNSQVFVDAAQEKKSLMDLYNFFAQSPNVNRTELERAILARYGFDPSKLMQQPPPKQANPPSVAMSIKGEDFNPQMPQSPIVLDAMSKLGVPIDMEAVKAAQMLAAQTPPVVGPDGQHGAEPQHAHGGTPAKAEPLNKHEQAMTGGMQGSGAPAPMGAGGHL